MNEATFSQAISGYLSLSEDSSDKDEIDVDDKSKEKKYALRRETPKGNQRLIIIKPPIFSNNFSGNINLSPF